MEWNIKIKMYQITLIILGFLSLIVSSNITIQKPQNEEKIRITTSSDMELVTAETTTTTNNSTTTTCEVNGTDCLTTVESLIENPVSNISNTTTKRENQREQSSETNADINICSCNLQVGFCDINCCCDPDCSKGDKNIFAYCEIDRNRFYDTKYCDYIQYIYINNTAVEWHVNQNGLFCVVSSNLPKSYVVQKDEPLDSYHTAQKEKPVRPFWAEEKEMQFLKDLDKNKLKQYRFGESVLIIKNDSYIDYFRLPKGFITRQCIFEDHIYYLKDEKYICNQIAIETDNDRLNILSYFENIKIVGCPALLNVTQDNIYKNCPKNVCLEVEPKICDTHLTNCTKTTKTASVKFECFYNFKENLNRCQNVVKKIHYKFYHNGSNGLIKIEMLGVLLNLSYHFGNEEFQFDQEFSTEFLWINQTKNFSQIFSGNPGYVTGKPIVISTKFVYENSTLMRRNSSSFLKNFLAFPKNLNRICLRNATYNIPIAFGYNLITKCLLNKKLEFKANQTDTEICKTIQNIIFDMWGLTQSVNRTIVVGAFGNANPFNIKEWNEILYNTDPKVILNMVQGNFSNKNTTLHCENISTTLHIDIFYARVDFKSFLNQQKILGVALNFNNYQKHTFYLNKDKVGVVLDLSLQLIGYVSFYDITRKKEKKFVDPPTLDFRLPYDFFYPFIKVDGGSHLTKPNLVAIIILLYWNLWF